jgi:hypothetical protein
VGQLSLSATGELPEEGLMGPGVKRRRVTAIVSGIVAIVPIAGLSAIAGGALKEKSASTTITTDDQFDSATAKCKRGSEAVSGGFEGTNYQAGSQPQLLPIDSTRVGKRRWTSAGAFDLSAGATSGEFTAYAYCDESKPRLKTKSSTTIVETDGPEAIGSATAKCKRGSEAVSGGFDSSDFLDNFNGPAIFPLESRREGKRKWTVSAFNFGEEAGELVAHAHCDRSEPGLKVKSATATVDLFPDTSFATARCKKGSTAVSGGFDSPEFDPSGAESETYPYLSRRSGKRRWTVAGFNESTSRSLEIVAYAYCEKK